MCTRFSLASPIDMLQRRFCFDGGVPYPPRPDIRPTEPVAIVRLKPGIEASGQRELALVRWGLIPHWVKDPRDFATLVNARAETILDKPSFKTPLRHRRCIVPADGWYDWTGRPGHKVAHLISPHAAVLRPLALAGLWDHWLGPDGSEIETMAIVTTAAIPQLATISERMPVLLDDLAAAQWLDVRGVEVAAAVALLRPSDALAFDCRQTDLASTTNSKASNRS